MINSLDLILIVNLYMKTKDIKFSKSGMDENISSPFLFSDLPDTRD